ncbi:MAG: EAL domain-containing protein [Myxococcales bacterium]|nr:EAL domain-containing protein [Myxococcales bacterium]
MARQGQRSKTTEVNQLVLERGLLSRFEAWVVAGASSSRKADLTHCERVRNVGLGIIVATAGFFVEALEGIRIQVPAVVISGLVVVPLFLGALFFLRRTQRFAFVGHVVLTGVLLATCANTYFTGGFNSPAIVALFILPIGAAILIDVASSLFWGTMSLAVFFAFWLALRLGLGPGVLPAGVDEINVLLNRGSVLVGTVAMISLFVAGQKRADSRIRSTLRRLETQAAHLKLLNEAAAAANESKDLQEAMSKCLERICVIKHWPLALAYERLASDQHISDRAVLYVAPTHADRERRLVRESFRLLVDSHDDGSDKGLLPGQSVHWDEDLLAANNPYRRVLAERLDLVSGVQVVINIGEQQWVLEFYSKAAIEPDGAFLTTLQSTGTQLGRVLERSRAHSRIYDLSYTDSVTLLSNRRHLNEDIEAIVSDVPDGEHVAVLQIGIDSFKTVNDALGRHVGDAILRTIASLLGDFVTELESKERIGWRARDCVFRVGGDEFAIVLSGLDTPSNASLYADQILELVSQPLRLKDREIHSRVSIGISISGLDASDGATLLQCADSALAAAKKAGGAQVRHYAATLNEENSRRLELENRLRRAIHRDELALHYQPLMQISGKEMAGVEALLRWTMGEGERVSPGDFIPIAESTDQIGAIGRWVLKTACEQLSQWLREGTGPKRIAVNVSVVQLREVDFVEFVVQLMAAHKIPRGALELEITESRLIGSESEVIARLVELQATGTKLSLDDFGTGYSSLSQLKRLPIAKLKIDRSFVDGIEHDANNCALVEAIVRIGNDLGLTIVAEGVETQQQAEILRELGANELQGFFFSRPVPPEEIETLFSDQAAELAPAVHRANDSKPVN